MSLKKLLTLGIALLSVSSFAATPISNLKLMTDANANGFRITGLIFPVLAGDAANKTYVDSLSTTILGAPLAQANTTSSAQLRAALTDEVGGGAAYFVGGALGTPASVNLTNGTNLPVTAISGPGVIAAARIGNGGDGSGTHFLADDQNYKSISGVGDALKANSLAQFAPTTSAELRGVLSDETGGGLAYFGGGALGTPASGVLTNATGLPISTGVTGLGTGMAAFLATTKPTTTAGYGITNGATIDLWGAINSVTPSFTTVTASKHIYVGSVVDTYGGGTPEGNLTAGVGSTYRRTDGGIGTTFYLKSSGTGSTGWIPDGITTISGTPASGDLVKWTSPTQIGSAQDGSGNLNITVAGNIIFTPGSTYLTQLKQVILQDGADPTKQMQDVLSAITTNTTRYNYHPDADTAVPVNNQTATLGQVYNGFANGVFTPYSLTQSDILPRADTIDAAAIASNSHTVPSNGTIDSVRLTANIVAPLTIVWPPTSVYSTSEPVVFYDVSGSISPMHPVTILASGTNQFNGNGVTSMTLTDPGASRTFRADPATGIWSSTAPKIVIQPFLNITPVGNTFTIVPDASVVKQDARLVLNNTVNTIAIPNPTDGMPFDLVLVSGGASSTVNLPSGSATTSGGTITLSASAGAVDHLRGSYVGSTNTFLWDAPVLNLTTPTPPAAPSALTATASGSNANLINLAWTDNSANETGFDVFRSLSSGGIYTNINTTIANAVSFADNGVVGATTYYYKIRAVGTGGNSAFTSVANATTISGAATADLLEWHFPEASGTTSTAAAGPNATLTYDSRTTSTQSTTGYAYMALQGLTQPSVPTVTVTGTGATNYAYKVIGYKNSGLHSKASVANTAVTNASVLDTSNFNAVSWSALTGADSYELWRTSGSPTGRVAVLTGNSNTSYTDNSSTVSISGSPPGTATDVYTATAASTITAGATITVSMWFNPLTYVGGSSSPIMFELDSGSAANKIYYTQSKIGVAMAGSTSGSLEQTFLSPSNNAWHHLVVVFDRSSGTGTIKVYIDNGGATYPADAVAATVSVTVATTLSGNGNFGVVTPQWGSTNSAAAPIFNFDDCRIYSTEQTPTAISAIYNGGAK